jgi:predicted dehydrogenase
VEKASTTRFAIIGCGTMGMRHSEILALTEGVSIVAVSDKDARRATELAAKLGARQAVGYEEILRADDVDAVMLCTPSSLHAEDGIAAAEAGKDILTEKPIDSDPARARRLIAAAEANRVCLSVISQNRWLEGSWALKQALEAGALGRPLHAHVSVKWHRDDKYYTSSDWRGRWLGEGGGVLMNQGIHYIDLLLWYLGEVEEVEAMVATSRAVIETEDIGLGLIRFVNGALAAIEVSTSAYPGFPERLEIHGSKGSCAIEQGKITFWKTSDGAEPPNVQFDPPTPADLSAKFIPFQRQYRDFLTARAQKRSPVVRPVEALRVIETVLSFYESVKSHSAVRIPRQ